MATDLEQSTPRHGGGWLTRKIIIFQKTPKCRESWTFFVWRLEFEKFVHKGVGLTGHCVKGLPSEKQVASVPSRVMH